MAIESRNVVQVHVKEEVFKRVRGEISRNLKSWQDWSTGGYAAAFDDAWRSGMRPDKDGRVDNIVAFVIAAAGTRRRAGDVSQIDLSYPPRPRGLK